MFGLFKSKTEPKSQNAAILKHLKTKGSITPIEALNKYGCFRLSARIHDLREKGHSIKTNIVETTNKNGNKVRYAKYTGKDL